MGSFDSMKQQTGGGSDPAAGSRSSQPGGVEALGPGAEFELIRGFYRRAAAAERADVRVGPGDDCAVVAGNGIVLTSDLTIEDVHFRRDWLSPKEVGHRATTASL